MSRTIRVENLTAAVTEDRLSRLFSQVAMVESVVVHRTSASGPTWALVGLATEEQAIFAALVFEGRKLGGRTLRITRVPDPPSADPNRVGAKVDARPRTGHSA